MYVCMYVTAILKAVSLLGGGGGGHTVATELCRYMSRGETLGLPGGTPRSYNLGAIIAGQATMVEFW